MEYQKIVNLLGNASNQFFNFRTKNQIEINDQSREVHNTNSDIRFNPTMLKSSLCDYSDAYILIKRKITITEERDNAAARHADERNKDVIFKDCAPFIKCKNEINNKEIDNANDIDIVMRMYNLMEYKGNYSKTSRTLWHYYKDKPNDNLAESESFKYKVKIMGNTPADGNTKMIVLLKYLIKIIVPLNYLSNFWRTHEMPLINCKVCN